MNISDIEITASTIRSLVLDALEKAGSGHPGLPLGCAELGAVIYGEILKHCPDYPDWIDRDRFVLSAGHGSILQYILLHLSGYDISLDDLKQFRQLGSKTPGHPEYGRTPGVETTTGPLGQGFANAVGMALAERTLAARFNTDRHRIIDHFTYVLAGDGDLMEGVTYESASFAGHTGLGKLIVFYDSNRITIDGGTEMAFSEDTAGRFEACGWQVLSGSAYNPEEIISLTQKAKYETEKPTLIILESVIGKGSPDYENTSGAHGSVFSREEIERTKAGIHMTGHPLFYSAPEAHKYFSDKRKEWDRKYEEWCQIFADWRRENPTLHESWLQHFSAEKNNSLHYTRPVFKVNDKIATRIAGGQIMSALRKTMPSLIGGSADLSKPNFGQIADFIPNSRKQPYGNYIHYGVREHAMGAVSNGLALHGGLRPFCGTFMAFSDYLRPSIRLAALMHLPVIYILSHDSVLIGADGPTHQPVEYFAALEAIPDLTVIRPGDAQETVIAWEMALLRNDGPTVLALARQDSEVYRKSDPEWEQTVRRGAYIVQDSQENPEVIVIATGSEVQLALQVQAELPEYRIRVVSMPSRRIFLDQDKGFKEKILPAGVRRIVIEAGIAMGWERFYAENPEIISIETFGKSGDGRQVADALGISAETLAKKIRQAGDDG